MKPNHLVIPTTDAAPQFLQKLLKNYYFIGLKGAPLCVCLRFSSLLSHLQSNYLAFLPDIDVDPQQHKGNT